MAGRRARQPLASDGDDDDDDDDLQAYLSSLSAPRRTAARGRAGGKDPELDELAAYMAGLEQEERGGGGDSSPEDSESDGSSSPGLPSE